MNKAFEKILEKLTDIGGCDADCAYDKGWDDAIDEAISIVQGVAKRRVISMEHDGCKGCKYERQSQHLEPCISCEGTKNDDYYKKDYTWK